MTSVQARKDLVVLVADKHAEFTVKGLLSRYQSLKIRQLNIDLFVHPHKDTGCLHEGHDFLRPFTKMYEHAFLLMDREGCGREILERERLEQEIEERLSKSGWDERAAAVVFDPELEVWFWSDSPHVATVLGWDSGMQNLKEWLLQKGFLQAGQVKPLRPKEAMESVLRLVRKPHSSTLFHELAQKVSLERCTDPAFLKFKSKLEEWFS